jgi:hypothetical protein
MRPIEADVRNVRRRGNTRAVACAGIAVAAFALAGCHGGTSGAANTGSSGSSGSASPSTATAASGLTPPGTHLRLGQGATAGWVPASIGLKPGAHQGYKIQVTVESIKKGAIGDFKNVQLKASERTSTPYYVKVRIKALSSTPPSGANDDPDVTLDAIDDRGQKQSDIIFIGTFDRCNNKTPPKPFVAGKSYESCLTYLMPGGGSIQKMLWNSGPSKANEVTPYFDKPIVWEG